MRALSLLPMLALAACASNDMSPPSLAPRAAESIDPRVPIPDPMLPANANAQLVEQLNLLVGQAVEADKAFRPLAERAEQLATAAGAKESESWVVAQQALSVAVAARGPVARAAGDIDALGSARVQKLGGIAAADLMAINAAGAKVAEIDGREAALIDRVQSRLAR